LPTIGKALIINGTTLWYTGLLSRFAIYGKALAPSRILAHYNASQVNAVTQTYQQIQLVLPTQSPVEVGDAYTLWPGCDKSLALCVSLGNTGSTYPSNAFLRYGGTPDTPPTDSSG